MRLLWVSGFLFFVNCLYCQNNVRLICTDGRLFKTLINERVLNKEPQAEVLLEKLTEDTVYLKLEFENNRRHGITIFLLEKGKPTIDKEFEYHIELADNKIKLNFSGMYDIIALPEPLVPQKPINDTTGKFKNGRLSHFYEVRNGKNFYFNNLP